MQDAQMIDLFWARDEHAISEMESVYGRRLLALARRIVNSEEDAQECVNDTYLKAWNTIPPQRPEHLYAYLAKICRFLAFGILDRNHAQKRRAVMVELTYEMQQCIPDSRAGAVMEGETLGQLLNDFLKTIPREHRVIFLRRYWFADSVEDIASRLGISANNVKVRLYRIRNKLKSFLEKEGIVV